MAKISDEEQELIKNRIRYYVAAQGSRWVSDSEIATVLSRDREFISQLRKEIRKEDLETMNKSKVAEVLLRVVNTYKVVLQELWGIALKTKDEENKPIPIKSKIYALVKIKEMEKELVELFQSVGIWPPVISEDLLKDPKEFTFNVVELLEQIIAVLPDEEIKQKVFYVVGEYAKNMTKPKQAESEQTVPEPQQPEPEQATPEQDKPEQQLTPQPEQQPTPQAESKIYEI